ncbi:MAG: outer membrane lipoprotein-sorting protein, partial [Candidatus Binatia bacterium]
AILMSSTNRESGVAPDRAGLTAGAPASGRGPAPPPGPASWAGALVSLWLVLGLAQPAPSADGAVVWLLRSQRARFPASDMRATFVLTVEGATGKVLRREGRILRRSKGGDLADRLYVFDAPEAIRGLALLSRDVEGGPSDQWLYLPAYGKARRVALHGTGDAFVGSDFSYGDLGRVRIEDGRHRLDKGRACGAAGDCVVVETTGQSRSYPYGRVVNFIDPDDYLPRRVEYYDRGGALSKVLTVDETATVGGFATPTLITMRSQRSGGKSRLRLRDVAYDVGLTQEAFTVERLQDLSAR